MNNSDLSSRLIKAQFIMSHTHDSVWLINANFYIDNFC